MTTAQSDPGEFLVDPQRLEELFEARTMITDLATAFPDEHEVQLHLTAIRFADELLFPHEAMMETHEAVGNDSAAADEAALVFRANQLIAFHLDALDRLVFQDKH